MIGSDDMIGTKVTSRSYMSTHFLLAANRLTKQSNEAEQEFRGDPAPIRDRTSEERQEALVVHRTYVLGAIVNSFAFLEAHINELFVDTKDEEPVGPAQELGAAARYLAAAWRSGDIDRLPLLTKYQAALILAGKFPFDPGAQPYQSLDVLRQLRNALVHYEPETRGSHPNKFEARLQSQQFPLHPWYERSANPIFPDKCISHGCADWAFSSSLVFADAFCSKMGIKPNYQYFRRQLM